VPKSGTPEAQVPKIGYANFEWRAERELPISPLALLSVFGYFSAAVAKVYIVSFRTHDDRRLI
jgi:hypothetical protein